MRFDKLTCVTCNKETWHGHSSGFGPNLTFCTECLIMRYGFQMSDDDVLGAIANWRKDAAKWEAKHSCGKK